MEKIDIKMDSKFPSRIDDHNNFRPKVRVQEFATGPDIHFNLLLPENQHQHER